ncbi:glycoside hydrolase family 43 protein [Marinicrinis lubricantis]|uniref:Glycoside hydrolase family 43 protein n=1 Tax=Marinicrinis lubricantis TaxID=2086470 RepID=A0ABW1IW85_9BACL
MFSAAKIWIGLAAGCIIIAAVLLVLSTDEMKSEQELTKEMNGELKQSNDTGGSASKVRAVPPASAVGKVPPNGNPLVSHKFGADPYALVYEDRVYLYMTNDVFEYDAAGNVKENTYGKINKITVISSDDLVNWTDHGVIDAAGPEGAAKWATQSWAPAIVHRVIDGKDWFFLYFANNASGIGVLTSESPTGPWVDPIGKALITRETPGVEDVTWLFDPAVLVDDDGKAYIYFGGGIPEGEHEMPGTSRVMPLGEDMISVVGEAVSIPAPYLFEDSGINKVDGKYYYTYCTNFYDGERAEGSPPPGEIAYMVSESPMGPWTYKGTILKNPIHFFGIGGNNHHVIFQFRDAWYIAYHAQTLSKAMGVPNGYRSTHLNRVHFSEDGSIQEIIADYKGVEQVKHLDPYQRVEAETIAWSAGVKVEPLTANDADQDHSARFIVTDIHDGDWTAVSKVDFGTGAAEFIVSVRSGEGPWSIELRLGSPEGTLIGTVNVPSAKGSLWTEVKTEVTGASGIHDLYMVYRGENNVTGIQIDDWQFSK